MTPPAPVAPPPTGATPPPPTGAPAAPSAPAEPVLTPPPTPTAEDPHALGACVGRLGFTAKRNARVAAGIASAVLDDGETVQQLVHGSYLGKHAVVVVTDRRLLFVNDREWKPDIRSIELTPDLTVSGMGDDRSATLTFSGQGEPAELSGIDAAQAREFAHRVRTRVSEG
jgi:hypothetical protein